MTTLTERDLLAAARQIQQLTAKRRVRWMVDRNGNERWGYEPEPLPKGWRHLCWEEPR